jgi:hypothetical protein
MAGSYNHCVDKESGRLYKSRDLNRMIEPGRDVYEAVEELYGMVWYLANGDASRVEEARQRYPLGLGLSPGVGASLPEDDE